MMQVSFFSGLELVGSGGTCKYQWIGYLLIQYWRKEIILARFTFVLNLLRFFLFQSFLIEYIVVTQFITRTFYKINVLGNNTMLCTNHGGMLGMGGLKDACKATRRITRQLHIGTDHFPNSMLFDTRNLQLHQAFSGFPYLFYPHMNLLCMYFVFQNPSFLTQISVAYSSMYVMYFIRMLSTNSCLQVLLLVEQRSIKMLL